jgi:hypothetical protein
MFEAYKVGVTLALQNQVSGVLGFIARDFMKANAQAKVLQASLKEIKLLGMGGALIGGVGFLGLGLIGKMVKPASEYVHQLELAKAAGMTQLEIAQATTAAWTATGTVMTTTATNNVAAIRELRMVFGDTQKAMEHMPTVQRLQSVLQTVRGGSGHDEAYTVAKALEMKGAVKDVGQFDTAADLMTKAIIASGGKVGASDFLSTFKYGRAATIGWDDRFTYGILPTLIQEMKSSGGTGGAGGPGNALMSAYAAVVGGSIPQKSLKVWQSLGMLDPSKVVWDKVGSAKGVAPGGIVGSDTFQKDPYQWTQKFLVPALVKAGYDTEDKQRQALQYLFPNRTAGFIMSQMALQGWKFDRDQALIGKASGLSSYDQLIRNDPKMAFAALSSQWENLKTAIGMTVIPVILPALRGLTSAFNSLGQFMARHQTITGALVLTFTTLSSLAAIGGTLMAASAGLKLIGIAFGPLRIAVAGMAVLPLAGIAIGLTAIGVALATLMPALYHKEIADKIDSTSWGRWLGDKLLAAKNFSYSDLFSGKMAGPQYSYAPPPSSKTVQVTSEVNLDGRKIASVVSQHQANSMTGPATSGAGFDGRQSFFGPSYNPITP